MKVFLKGNEGLKDHVFVRFGSPEAMESAVQTIKEKNMKLKDKFVWSNPDRPAHIRAPNTFLFALKKLLVSWGFGKRSVYVDPDTSSMWCASPGGIRH